MLLSLILLAWLLPCAAPHSLAGSQRAERLASLGGGIGDRDILPQTLSTAHGATGGNRAPLGGVMAQDQGDRPGGSPRQEADEGLLSGSGWINSPAGAYTGDPNLAGRATFEFAIRYRGGDESAAGQAECHFRIGDLDLYSASYEWLVVDGDRAQLKGAATINGRADYSFMLSVVDGQGDASADRLRLKIWDTISGSLLYDSQPGAVEQAQPTAVVAGGDILISSSAITIKGRRPVRVL